MCWEFVRAEGRTGLPVWPWRPTSRSAAVVKAARSAPRSGLALTAERSEGLGGMGGLPPIGFEAFVSEANSFRGVWGEPQLKSYPQARFARASFLLNIF